MKLTAAVFTLGLTVLATVAAPLTPGSFPYRRDVEIAMLDSNQHGVSIQPNGCAVLDSAVFAHAAPTLDDLRLYSSGGDGRQEVPYAITLSQTAATGDPARILDLGLKSPRQLSFDLEMPSRPYSSVALTLNAANFLASARVTGLHSLDDKSHTYLGVFTLFDLAAQHLGRNSTFAIAESTFPYLHVELSLTPAPGNDALQITPAVVASAEVPPSRLAQILYTPVANVAQITQAPRESVATFTVAAHVPVERVTFALDPTDHTNFSRTVTISSRTASTHGEDSPLEQLSGEISRVHVTEAGQDVREESLSVPAILGSNAQSSATIRVAVQNGDDRPLKLRSVTLEMRQRKLCFAAPTGPATLYYGAPEAPAPVYDFGRLFNAADPVRAATLGPETPNPQFIPVVEKKSLSERYPQLLWIALIATVSVLALIAFRSAKRIG